VWFTPEELDGVSLDNLNKYYLKGDGPNAGKYGFTTADGNAPKLREYPTNRQHSP
jgi:hypothetical protein